jgi:phage-related protein
MYTLESRRRVVWVGSSLRDLRAFPQDVRRDIGQSLYAAQQGETDPSAKPLKGFGGGSVLEIVARHRGDTWRAVYTKNEIELIRQRLTEAGRLHRERQN